MTIELTEAQQRKIEQLLKRANIATRGQTKTQNLLRMIHVELTKSQRRAKRSAKNKDIKESTTIKLAEQSK